MSRNFSNQEHAFDMHTRTCQVQGDVRIRNQLKDLTSESDYWDFRREAKRDAIHGLTQYPAMMVPAMQGKLLDVICDVIGPGAKVVDPFVGSGTTLVETMRKGLDFWGQDINPLAVLISLTKTGPFDVGALSQAIDRVHDKARHDRRWSISVDFPGRDKWFDISVARDLSRIRRAICDEDDLWVRRMLWVSLAETVRLSSNSRTSTFKLHIRSLDELSTRKINVISLFHRLSKDAEQRVACEARQLEDKGYLAEQKYAGTTCVQIGHSSKQLPGDVLFDLLITSPPYGDGTSTVPYGQYSYLPLQWIDLSDICDDEDGSCLRTTQEIDTRALGGSRRNAIERSERALDESPSLKAYIEKLSSLPRDRHNRVAAFFADLLPALDTICQRMKEGSYMIWTVGNRCVGGYVQPLDKILTELLQERDCNLVEKVEREIPNKRMANRNSISQTMKNEQVIILRRGVS